MNDAAADYRHTSRVGGNRRPPRSSRLRSCTVVGLLLVAMSAIIGCGARAVADVVASSGEPPVVYRRVMVPAETPAAWPTGGEKFLAIESRQFEAWIAAANRPASSARIMAAEYSARLEGRRLVDGRGAWTIASSDGRTALLSLGGQSLPVTAARWRDAGDRPVRLGWWPRAGRRPASYGLEVPRSSVLEFRWHAPPGVEAGSSVEIPLRLPAAAATRLILELPDGKRPVLAGSIALESSELEPSIAASSRGHVLSDAGQAAPGQWRRWVLASGGSTADRLLIEDPLDPSPTRRPAVLVHEDRHYNVTNRGLDVELQLKLDAYEPRLRELSLRLPRSLHLVEATDGRRRCRWRIADASEPDFVRAVVALPARSPEGECSLTLTAWAPLVLGESWQLPEVDVEDASWMAGTIRLSVAESLELQDVMPTGCVQADVAPDDDAQRPGETLSFQSLTPTARIDVLLGPQRPTGDVQLYHVLDVGQRDIRGKQVARIRVARGRLYSLTAELLPGWSVDAVDTIPADSLGQWQTEARNGKTAVILQLNRAVTPAHPLTVVTTGKWPALARPQPLRLRSLTMLQWSELKSVKSLLRLGVAEPYQLELRGDVQPTSADEITDEDARLVDPTANGSWFDLASTDDDAAVRFVCTRANFDADIHLDAIAGASEINLNYRIRCKPPASGLDQLRIMSSAALAEPPQWTLAESGERLTAERVSAGDLRSAGAASGGELWRVALPQAYARPVSLVNSMRIPVTAGRPVPLLSLPDAAAEQGRVTIRATQIAMPSIVAQGLTPVPFPDDPRAESSPADTRTIAAYRYEPSRFRDHSGAPRLRLGPPPDSPDEGSSLVAATVDVQSAYAADGVGFHRAAYQLDRWATSSIELKLPTGAELLAASMDGRPLVPTVAGWSPNRVVLALPRQAAPGLLAMDLRTESKPLASGRRLLSPLPRANVAVVSGAWTVWIPSGFSISDGGAPAGGDAIDAAAAAGQEPNDFPGWHAFASGFVLGGPAAVTIVHAPTSTAWALSTFLACVLGAAIGRPRAVRLVTLAAAAALGSVLLPAAYAPLAIGACLGLVAAPICLWLVRNSSQPVRDAAPTPQPTASARSSSQGLMLLVAAAGVMLSLAPASHAQPTADSSTTSPAPRSDAPAASSPIQQVLIPVDEDQNPVGTMYFLSDQFVRLLMQASADAEPARRSWLLTGMHVDGELSPVEATGPATTGKWTLAVELETLARDAVVELPFVQDEAAWPAAASLDGIPAPLAWNREGLGCRVTVPEPGRYRLTLQFEPVRSSRAGRTHVKLSVLPLPGATLRLAAPDASARPDLQGGRLETLDQATGAIWTGELDGSGRLAIDWRERPSDPGSIAAVVDQLQWVRIRPASATLDVKYVLHHGASWPEDVTIRADHRCELLRDFGDGPDCRAEKLANGELLITVARDARPGSGRREVWLAFRIRGASTIGQFRIPAVEVVSPPIEHRWLAVSADASLECEPLVDGTVDSQPAADFAVAWGDASGDESPQFALAVGESPLPSLAVRPRLTHSEIDQSLHVAVAQRRLDVLYEAAVAPQAQHRFRCSLSVPPELSIDDVAAERLADASSPSGSAAIPLRWVRLAADRVHVLFTTKVTAPYRLKLWGTVPVAGYGAHRVPVVAALESPRSLPLLRVYRDADVRVTVLPPTLDVSLDSGPAAPPNEWSARYAGSYVLDPTARDAVRLVTKASQTVFHGRTLTTLTRDRGLWFATLACRLHVEQGEIDRLRFDVPAVWAGPFDVRSVAVDSRSVLRDAQRSRLTAQLAKPARAGDVVTFEIRSPLSVAAGRPVAVPRIQPLTTGRWERYVSVPTTIDLAPASWRLSGVEPANPPSGLPAELAAAGESTVYRVANEAFDVALGSRATRRSPCVVRLAEMTAWSGPTGRIQVTRFDVTPNGLGQCVIELPDDQRLVRVTLDGHVAVTRRLEPQRTWVELGPPDLPQTVEVVTRSLPARDAESGPSELRRPALVDRGRPIPMELSLWSLCSPATSARPRVASAAIAARHELAALRLERLVSISESATAAVIESPARDGASWYATWSPRLASAERVARAALVDASERPIAASEVQPAGEPIAQAISRSETWRRRAAELFATLGQTTVAGDTARGPTLHPAEEPTPPGYRWTYFVADGGQDRLKIDWLPADWSPLERREVVASVLLLVSLMLWFRHAHWSRTTSATADSASTLPDAG